MEHYFQCSGNVVDAKPQGETKSSQASSFGTKTKLSMTRKCSDLNVILVCPRGLPMFLAHTPNLVEIIDVDEEAKFQKKNYKPSRKRQGFWATSFSWAKMLQMKDGKVHNVKCGPCSKVTRKHLILGLKSNTLENHASKRKVTKDLPQLGVKKDFWFINKQCQHLKNAMCT